VHDSNRGLCTRTRLNPGRCTPCGGSDVDDLQDIDRLEEYIDCSSCILLFLSKGCKSCCSSPRRQHCHSSCQGHTFDLLLADLQSKNCLREVVASVSQQKPRVLVWEANPAKGGAPVEELRDKECPPELRGPVFDGQKVIQWHRIAGGDPPETRPVAASGC
jgi:hypothetical protein